MLSRLRRWPTCANVARIGLAAGLLGLASSVALAASHPAIRIAPRIGIAGVRLNEKRSAVEAELGPGRYIRHGGWAGYYAYGSGSVTVFVGYGAGRADAIDTRSRAALVYRHPLREGLAKLKPILIAHGWKVLSCQGETFTDLGQGGPGTGIAWRGGKLDFVQIDAGGSVGDACLPL